MYSLLAYRFYSNWQYIHQVILFVGDIVIIIKIHYFALNTLTYKSHRIGLMDLHSSFHSFITFHKKNSMFGYIQCVYPISFVGKTSPSKHLYVVIKICWRGPSALTCTLLSSTNPCFLLSFSEFDLYQLQTTRVSRPMARLVIFDPS